MNFSVDWDAVEEEIAALWMSAPDRDAVNRALHRIDLALQHDPSSYGESRGATAERLVFDGLVSALFRVISPNRVVILAVGPVGHRS